MNYLLADKFEIGGTNTMNIILDNGAFKPEFAHKTDAGADLRKEANKNRQKR